MLLLCSACYLLPQRVTLLDAFTSDIQDIPSISLWYFCHWLRYLSLVSRPGKYRACRPVKCSPTLYAEYLSGLIGWFIYRYFLGSCTHSRYSWAFGTLKQQCQHPDLRGIPSRYSFLGDRYGHRAQGACAEHHQRRGEAGERDTTSPHKPIPPPLTLRSGREGHRAFRETRPTHWTPHTPLREWNKARGTEMTDLAHRLESYYCWYLHTTKS